jgi:hypothetical protein
LQNKDNKVVRHYAALELEELGEKAAEYSDIIRAARKDSYEYVQRVSARIVNNLEQ